MRSSLLRGDLRVHVEDDLADRSAVGHELQGGAHVGERERAADVRSRPARGQQLGELGLVTLDLLRFVRHEADELEPADLRSEEHTSELQSLMRLSYAVYSLKKK